MSVKAKLTLLVAIALAALLGTGQAGWISIRGTTASIHEIGDVRRPSVQSLLTMSEDQTAVRAANRWVLNQENDDQAQSNFDTVLKARDTAQKNIESGWKLYEPLPQTPEEAVRQGKDFAKLTKSSGGSGRLNRYPWQA